MILNSETGLRGILVNADTSERIPFARWANTETGEWEAFKATPDGKAMAEPREIVTGKCRLRFFRTGYQPPRDPEPMRSPKEQLAEIYAIAPDFVKDWKPILMTPGIECDAHGCHKMAEYETGDHAEIEPAKNPDGTLARRAVTVAVHRWCSWHFKPPLVTDRRGVTSEKEKVCRPS